MSSTKVKAFVDDLYIVVKWKPDPPGELEWHEEKDEKKEGETKADFHARVLHNALEVTQLEGEG